MKKKRFKVGIQQVKSFPVVNLRFRPVGSDHTGVCSVQECQSLKISSKRPRALFLVQICSDRRLLTIKDDFTEKEHGELAWEKAYREQKAGKEPDPIGYPVCAQCSMAAIRKFLNDKDEQQAILAITNSISTGKDIILFDRNLSRERTYPAIACETFETLADFRRAYWEQG